MPCSGADARPRLLPGAPGDGLADADLAVAVGEGGEIRRAGAAGGDEVVERQVELLESVGEALGVASGVVAGLAGLGREQGGVAIHQRVRSAAAAEPEVLGGLAVPDHRSLGPADLEVEPVLAASLHL